MDLKEMKHFQKVADVWWGGDEILPLRSMNEIRIPYILERLKSMGVVEGGSNHPLKGLSILDVGCGGGFLTEPFAELGAEVTGIDGCPELIEVAKKHLLQEGKTYPNLTYHAETIQDFAERYPKQYDVVLGMEFIDHVSDKRGVVAAMAKCMKPGGSVFISTMNKCFLLWIFCKIVAEYVGRYVPRGAHDYEKFISPDDLWKMFESYNCTTKDVKGMYYNYLRGYWFWLGTTSTWYFLHAVKNTSA